MKYWLKIFFFETAFRVCFVLVGFGVMYVAYKLVEGIIWMFSH